MTEPIEQTGVIFTDGMKLLRGLLNPMEDFVPGLKVRSFLPDEDNFSTPLLLTRTDVDFSTTDAYGDTDNRFDRRFVADIQTFCSETTHDGGHSAEDKNHALQELAFQVLQTAWLKQQGVPGVGYINTLRIASPSRKVSDWETATGVNQYANLSRGLTRYQAKYQIVMRPDFKHTITQEQLLAIIADS